jgi:hypothetical protein
MKKPLIALGGILLGVAAAWLLQRPRASDATATAAVAGNPVRTSVRPKPAVATPGPRLERQAAPANGGTTPAERVRAPVSPPSLYAPITRAEMLRPNRQISDPVIGVSVTYPEGWSVGDIAVRWGVNGGENTVFFTAPGDSKAVPSMYYRKYTDGPAFDMANPEATLRDMARQKEQSRRNPNNEYTNDPDSFVFRTIDGNPSLSYFATYTQGEQVRAEYFLRILGPTGYVMFFTSGPVSDVQAIIPTVFQMGGTVKPP